MKTETKKVAEDTGMGEGLIHTHRYCDTNTAHCGWDVTGEEIFPDIESENDCIVCETMWDTGFCGCGLDAWDCYDHGDG